MVTKTQIKYIQSLHHKKYRDEKGVFFAETPKVVTELITTNFFPCLQIFALPHWIVENASLLNQYGVKEVAEINEIELDKLSALMTANTVVGVFKKREPDHSFDTRKKLTLALDNIQDPGNMGTIIRTADWFGIKNIVCNEGCAEMYNTKVVQSTMGSLARVNIIYVNLTEWLSQQKALKMYATVLNGTPLSSIKKIKEGILIIGNESQGISKEVLAMATEKITIEKIGKAESLNAGVATGIVLSHIV